tara:strand:- start:3 stop:299 length:297 start_codon:yes stop_codon:yes gene_type:complete
MSYDHEAIYKAYSGTVVMIDDDLGAFDRKDNQISLDQSKIDAARAELDAEYAKVKYQDDRRAEYPDWGTQLDYIYHNGIDKWKTDIVDPVKKKYPKPE